VDGGGAHFFGHLGVNVLDVQIVGDQRIVATLRDLGAQTAQAAKDSIGRSTVKVHRLAVQKANGPVLKNRTGTLYRAINFRVVKTEAGIVGTVGIKLTYAAAHEFGCHKTVSVPAHLRMMKVAWGRPVKEPRQIMVGAHSMKMNLPERSYLRSSLKELRGDIVADLRASVNKATAK
jgi:phage gpG-like protein